MGWEENFKSLKTGGLDSLIPKYFGKFPYVRFAGKFYGANRDTELRFLRLILLNEIEWLLKSFSIDTLFEFGCGTGHNLFFLQSIFKDLRFVGTDWSRKSGEIIQYASTKFDISNVATVEPFDYFKPNRDLEIGDNTGIMTIASLEQVGGEFEDFLDFIIARRPRFAIHIEPEEELLDSKSTFDQSSIDYIRKRGYLTGFMSGLKKREIRGEIMILRIIRSHLGSFPMDGYSVFVWAPK
jgi:SAM-dependent methyltransferase